MVGTPAPVLEGVVTTAATGLVPRRPGVARARGSLWSRDGRELFFGSLDGRQMFAVPVQSGTTLVAGRPQVLFEFAMLVPGGGNRPYDIAPDGRFLIIRSGQAEAASARRRT